MFVRLEVDAVCWVCGVPENFGVCTAGTFGLVDHGDVLVKLACFARLDPREAETVLVCVAIWDILWINDKLGKVLLFALEEEIAYFRVVMACNLRAHCT